MQNAWSVFLVFLRLGCTSFGGPVAHLGYFREEFVAKKKWLSEQSYADLVALCQFLPGPASSQVGMAIGMHKAGFAGLFAAWIGFTLPSAAILAAFALGITHYSQILNDGVIYGLKIVALVVVIQAVWGMGKNLCYDRARFSLMVFAAGVVLLMPSIATQMLVLIIAGLIGSVCFSAKPTINDDFLFTPVSKKLACVLLLLFFLILFALPVLANSSSNQLLILSDIFYRAGSLVFGGGHVVLPLLQADMVPSSMLDNETFLAGYGAAQAVPGPLFTFASFLGAAVPTSSPLAFAALCVLMIFVPSFLLVVGVLPFWQVLRSNGKMQASLSGVNASVIGLLLAALYDPIWVSSINGAQDVVFALVIFAALIFWKLPVWLVVIVGAFAGFGLELL